MHRFRKAVQQQHQRRPGRTGGDGVEDKMRRDDDLFLDGHGVILDRHSGRSMVDHISTGAGGIVQPGKSAVLEAAQRALRGRTLYYLRSILFDAAVVILTLVVSLLVP